MKTRAARLRLLRGKGMDADALHSAEQLLRSTGDAELSPEWIDATVHSVTRSTHRRRLVRGLMLAAAAVLLGMLSIASGSVLWPSSRDSINTLDYPTALRMLAAPYDHDSRYQTKIEQRYRSALKIAWGRIDRVLSDFRKLEGSQDYSPQFRAKTTQRLNSLREALNGPVTQTKFGSPEDVKDFVDDLMRPGLSETERGKVLDRLYRSALDGILTMREMTEPEVLEGRDHFLHALRSEDSGDTVRPRTEGSDEKRP